MDKLEELKQRYKGYMVNEDIRWCVGEIERLRKLVKRAYIEGWNDCDEDEIDSSEAFEGSMVNRILKEEEL